jgi:predicted Mrr-cat superfamily restriction endonuclease
MTQEIRPNAVTWLVRGGKKAAHIDTLVRRDTAAISWATVIGSVDLREIDDATILEAAARAGRSDPEEDLDELRGFQTGIVDGDVVIMPDSPRGDVLVGVAAGPYDFNTTPVAGDLRHRRSVRWLGRYLRDRLSPGMRDRMDQHHRTVWRLPDQQVWLSIAHEVAEGGGEPAEKTSSRSQPGTRGSAPSASDRVCSRCGLLMAPARFDAGAEVCRDCA